MNIVALVSRLKTRSDAENFIALEIPTVEYDLVELYIKDTMSLTSEIVFFNAESIPNEVSIEIDGVQYENLFPLYMAQEIVEEYVQTYNNTLSDLEIANRILEYKSNDA